MAPEWQRQTCTALPWDEVLTMKGGAAENKNALGFSHLMRRCARQTRWLLGHNDTILLRNRSEGDVSSEDFQPLPAIIKWAVSLWQTGSWPRRHYVASVSLHTPERVTTQPFSENLAKTKNQWPKALGNSKLDCSSDSPCAQMTESGVPWRWEKSQALGPYKNLKITDLRLKA